MNNMFAKVLLLGFIGVALAEEHAYSSQSITRHDQHEHGNHQQYQQAAAPVHQQYQQAGHAALSSQSVVHHDSHQDTQYHVAAPQYHVAAPQYHVAPIVHQAPVHLAAAEGHKENDHDQEYYTHPKYAFEYKVSDPHTGDNKYQQESRDGDVVTGVYSLHEADGSIRTVKYHADKHSGFNAEVHSEGTKHIEQAHH